jgi:protein-disulfide isomerase
MKLTSESKFFLGIIGGTILILITAVIFLSQPTKPIEKSRLIGQATHTTGNTDSNVWLAEFSDFECPACRVFAPTIETLITDHKDTLLFVYRHFPLPQHLFSMKSAIAAEAAGKQNKFWEMSSALYKEPTLSDTSITALGKTLGLNEDQYASDSANPAIEAAITEDVQLGDAIGIRATPTFFLNGVKLEVKTPDDLKKKVENFINNNSK